jgi:hypothetical protein
MARTTRLLVLAAAAAAVTAPLLVAPATAAAPSAVRPAATSAIGASAVGASPAPAVAAAPYVPTRKLPKNSGLGRRIVYQRAEPQHVWIVNVLGKVIRDFPVTGRRDWPLKGRYSVFSKSPWSTSTVYHVDWRYMVRFAHGHSADIGFHSIPTRDGVPIQSVRSLGRALGLGGCVRSADANAAYIYRWAGIGTKVIVL